jgi:predicted nuclease of restriction endonuclease-like RecB superfamily
MPSPKKTGGNSAKSTYRNKFERDIAKYLKRHKVRFSYETERLLYYIAGHYRPDFIISTPNGKVYIETKGYLRPEDKRKLVAVKSCNPSLDLRILFYEKRPSQIRWAERHGFRFAFKVIPTEWIQGR